MRTRILVASGAVALTLLVVLWAPVLVAQAPSGTRSFDPTTTNTDAAVKAASDAAKAAAALKNWKPGRTAWGDPDLRGYWLLATYTPLERPAAIADKAFYTEQEAVEAFKRAVEADAEVDPRTVHYDWKEYGMDAWQAGAKPNLRTSLIVDPPDGRIPPLTPEAQQRRAAAAAAAKVRSPLAGIKTFGNTYTRCILGLGAAPLVRGGNPGAESAAAAAGVTSESQLIQSPGYVVIVTQSNSDVRIIPVDGRPHLPQNMRVWWGDSRGHWEGETLVVDTTNFKDRAPGVNFQGSTDALHLVERFTRTGPNTLKYEYTVSDPSTWTKPWSVEAPIPRIDPPLYEFACHEQNYGVMNVVRGTQVREGTRRTGEAAASPAPRSEDR
jgi:hypothetical protein